MDATSGSTEQPFSMVYAGISWRELEPRRESLILMQLRKR